MAASKTKRGGISIIRQWRHIGESSSESGNISLSQYCGVNDNMISTRRR